MRCQGMKGAIALLLVTALFLGTGMSTKSLAAIEPKVKFENDGFLIEDADIPDLSKIIKQNNLEKNFVDIVTSLFNVIGEYYECETDDDFRKSSTAKNNIGVCSTFVYYDELTDELKRFIEDSVDAQIGYSKIEDKRCVAYATTDVVEKMSRGVYIEQQEKTIFIKPFYEPANQSKTMIRRLIDARDENISYYDFDMILAMQYRGKQLGL